MINQRFLVFATILLIFISLIPAHANTPIPIPRDELIEEIKAHADRHIRGGSTMQTQLVVDLYRNNTAGLSSAEIAQIYEGEYTRLKEVYKSNPWEQLQPDIGWVLASIFFLLLIFHDILKKLITNLVESVGNRMYNRLAGNKFFLKITLQHYKKSLIYKYHKLSIPFRHERPLDMRKIYVPVKVDGSIIDTQNDTNKVIADFHKLMVLGSPGAGKSMLLKHVVLEYAEDRFIDLFPDQPVMTL